MSESQHYTLLDTRPVPDYDGTGRLYRHKATGAQVFHLENDDSENMFAFAFATYPHDSTGVAHILEHTVLSGSEAFPVKDPFLQLLKGSVNTFLNAMTYPDKTVYPAASPVRQDLFNMMTVYGDAVFLPLLKPELFRQEGHRLQFDGQGALERTGIVYNEMKGNYSSHDSVVGETCFQSLFPDSIYGYDSGGDPAVIPQLSYEQFVAFHRRYYHPANARIVLYGNIPSEDYLSFLHDRFLSRFAAGETVAPPQPQPRWDAPRRVDATYPLDDVADLSGRTSVTVNWLLFPVTESRRVLDAAVLSEILLGHSGSPLARALLECGLGQDLSPVLGLETDLHEAVFSAGLRGSDPEHTGAIEDRVIRTLWRLSEEGLNPDSVEGALRRVEFSNREIKGGPSGMRLMRRALRSWMYGADPFEPLFFQDHMEALRGDLKKNPRFFEQMIRSLLLDNPHRSTVTVRPDADQSRREAEELRAELEKIAGDLSPADRERIDTEARQLRALQDSPDDPEALANIPFLSLSDVPHEIQTVDYETRPLEVSLGELYRHRRFTNGIVYLDLAFDFGQLSPRQERLLNLLGAAITELGLPGVPHHELSDEINLKTGGISAFVGNQTRYADRSRVRRLFMLRVRVLERSWREGMELFARLIRELDFSDLHRLSQVIDELLQEVQSAVVPAGHYFAGLRAGSELHDLIRLEEGMNGVTQLETLRALETEAEAPATAQELAAELKDLFSLLVDPRRMNVNITADEPVLSDVETWLPELVDILRTRHDSLPPAYSHDGSYGGIQVVSPSAWADAEYLIASASVNYVAVALPGVAFDDPLAPAQDLLAHVLRTGPLWEMIRMRGGAYGAFASSRTTEGLFSFGSYRDPNTVKTLEAYRRALRGIVTAPPPSEQLDLAKVSVLGRELKPLTPRDSAFTNFRRRLHDIDDVLRRSLRDKLRGVTPRQIAQVAELLEAGFERRRTVILGGTGGLEEWTAAAEAHTGEIPRVHLGV